MAYGTLIGGFLQLRRPVAEPAALRRELSAAINSSVSDPGVRQIIRLMGPAIIGTAAVQINVFVNTNFASAIIDPATGAIANGPVSWLNYAFRFMQFPIGVFGVAIATATLPSLSRSTANPDYQRVSPNSGTLVGAWYFSCAFRRQWDWQCWREPIVALVFEHGKFTAFDTVQTANALAAYAHRPGGLRRDQSALAGVLRLK